VSESGHSLTIRVGEEEKVTVSFPPSYPASAPPTYSLTAPRLSPAEKSELAAALAQLYLDNAGECVVFHWTEHLRTFLQTRDIPSHDSPLDQTDPEVENISLALEESRIELCPEIVTGEVLEDRKSVFQAHTASVHSPEEVKLVLSKLLTNKKIAQATHNILAFRIFLPEKKIWLSDCDDDGEDAAGGRLLHLLEILDVTNRLVVEQGDTINRQFRSRIGSPGLIPGRPTPNCVCRCDCCPCCPCEDDQYQYVDT